MKKERGKEKKKLCCSQAKSDAKFNAIFDKLTVGDLQLLCQAVREDELHLRISGYLERNKNADEALKVLREIYSKI